ncbi:MAG: hypothetical protein MJZ69_01290 [Bacteroidaceae bacterium]|nr:hypothetical protein [Bacteroidaceae bacterium]
MAEFVSINEDKFQKQTIYNTAKPLIFDMKDMFGWDIKATLCRVVKMPDTDSLVVELKSSQEKTALGLGDIAIIADDTTINLTAFGNKSKREYFNSYDEDGTNVETCYYELSKENLCKICSCSSFAMKLYSRNGSSEIGNANAFAVYCKLFYNAVYDNTAYTDVVAKALGEFTKGMAHTSKFSDIKLDGSGANGGCMGMIALFITMTGAAIGGLCSLI